MDDIRDSAIDLHLSQRYSDDSEGTDIRDLVDRQLNPLPSEFTPSAPSPETDSRSSGSNPQSPSHEKRRRSHRRDRGRYNEVQQELVKLFVSEEQEARQHRRLLRAALDRLDSERQRAQEAERRALDLAERFRVVNDARLSAQAELARVQQELSFYKLEYDVAQRELKRGQEMLNHAEAQRDDAEATAARARSAAQRIKEKHLVFLAKEEGRKLGYEEGLKRGYEQSRVLGYNSGRRLDVPLVEDEDEDEGEANQLSLSGGARTEPLTDLPMRNLPSPPRDGMSLDHSEAEFPPHIENAAGAQGSRFHEDMTPSTTPQFLHPIPIHEALPPPSHPITPIPPDNMIPVAEGDNYIPMPPAHEFQHLPTIPQSSTPPLPIPIPPPHASRVSQASVESAAPDYAYARGRSSPRSLAESVPSTTMSNFDLLNSPKSSSRNMGRNTTREVGSGLSVIHEVSSSMEHSPAMDSMGMPEPISFPAAPVSIPSRQAEVPPPNVISPRSRQTSQRLADEIRYSDPGAVEEWRRTTADETHSHSSKSSGPRRPAVLTVPAPLSDNTRPRSVSSDRTSSAGRKTPGGGYGTSQRQQPPSRLRQSHTLDGDSDHPANSSSEIEIQVEPPSAPESHSSPTAPTNMGMLSPMIQPGPIPRFAPPEVPTEPNTPTMRSMPSMGTLPAPPSGLPPGFVPSGPPTPVMPKAIPIHAPVAQSSPRIPGMQLYSGMPTTSTPPIHQRPASTSTPLGRNDGGRHSRSRSGSGLGTMSSESLRSETPIRVLRPPSAMSGSSAAQGIARSTTPTSRPQYASAPTPPGVRYPDPPFIQAGGRPDRPPSTTGNMSPRSISSRLSGHQRSLSMNAGMTPGPHLRPLSGQGNASEPRRVPSAGSMSSTHSRRSISHFDPEKYVDPAYLSTEDLVSNVPSPQTAANTRANAGSPSHDFRLLSASRGSEPPVIPYSIISGRKGR